MILNGGASLRVAPAGSGLCYSITLAPREPARWALVADTHVGADRSPASDRPDPAGRLRRVVAEILADRRCGAMVNGDLALSVGSEADYRRFREIVAPLAAAMPVVLGVGNHDDRGNLLAALSRSRDAEWLASVVDQGPYRMVQLDSHLAPGHVGGEVGDEQLGWLEGLLRTGGQRRTIVSLHHPGESTSEGCRDFGKVAELASEHPSVEAIVTGHDHAFSVDQEDGVHRIGLPAAGFAFEPGTPCGWVAADLSASGLVLTLRSDSGREVRRLAWRRPNPARAAVDSGRALRL